MCSCLHFCVVGHAELWLVVALAGILVSSVTEANSL